MLYVIGIIGQWLACVTLGGGIAIEIIYEADVGFLAITIGSAIFAAANKFKLMGYEADEWRRKKKDGYKKW